MDIAPSFIASDKIAFMSPDSIILCYKVFSQPGEKDFMEVTLRNGAKQIRKISKQMFNVTQCRFPGSTGEVSLDSLIFQDQTLIGENIMLTEIEPIITRPPWINERVAPNYFNKFFQEQAYNENDSEDAGEMKYIQNHFKTKFELMPRMYTGYIFQSKDYISDEEYQTSIHIVNTFSFYQWRSMTLLKKARLLVEDLTKNQV